MRFYLEGDNIGPSRMLSADGIALTIFNICKYCPDGSIYLSVIQSNASNPHGYVFLSANVNVLSE